MDHVEPFQPRLPASFAEAAEAVFELLAAPGEGGSVEEAHHLLDLDLEIAPDGRQGLVRLVLVHENPPRWLAEIPVARLP